MCAQITDEQETLRATVRAALERNSAPEAIRAATGRPHGYDAELWSVLCQQIGITSLAIPGEHTELDAGLLEVALVADELGRTLTPCPFLSSVLATYALRAAGDDDAASRLFARVATGGIVALAWADAHGKWSTETVACTASRTRDHYVVDGTAYYVLDGDIAGALLVLAHVDDELGVFEVDPTDPGLRRHHSPTMDLTRRMATLSLAGARAARIGTGDFRPALRDLRDVACLVLAAEQAGTAERALELTVDYTKQRYQFGRAIGSFQALKHRMADLYVLTQTARSAARAGIDEDRERHAAVAKAYCSEAACQVTAEMIQLHGGIAITWEHEAQLYFKRAHGSAQLFGQSHEHVARIGALVGLGSAPA